MDKSRGVIEFISGDTAVLSTTADPSSQRFVFFLNENPYLQNEMIRIPEVGDHVSFIGHADTSIAETVEFLYSHAEWLKLIQNMPNDICQLFLKQKLRLEIPSHYTVLDEVYRRENVSTNYVIGRIVHVYGNNISTIEFHTAKTVRRSMFALGYPYQYLNHDGTPRRMTEGDVVELSPLDLVREVRFIRNAKDDGALKRRFLKEHPSLFTKE